MWRPKIFLRLLFLSILTPSLALAQTDPCSRRVLSAYVFDSQGRLITGLASTDFEARFHGKQVKVTTVTPDQRPHRIVILLDASASMAHKWEPALYLATHIVESSPPNTQMALLVFDKKIEQQLGFSAGRRAIATELQGLHFDPKRIEEKLHGRTALYDALLAGLRILGSPTSSDILYAITDAGDNSSHAEPKDIAKALASSGVHLFVSILAMDPVVRNRTPEEIMGPEDLSDLVRRTGGELILPYENSLYDPKNPAPFMAALKMFESSMLNDYLLDLELPEPATKYESWTLKLSKEKREQWRNAKVLYTKELAPCQP
jgi:hypothetical protein